MVNEAFSVYGRNVVALIASAIVVFGIVGVAAGLLQNAGGVVLGVLAGIIWLVGVALYTGFVVRVVQDVRDGGRDQSVGDLLSSAAPAIGALIVFGILFAIGVAIGLALVIVPGLILLTLWSWALPRSSSSGRGRSRPSGAAGVSCAAMPGLCSGRWWWSS